jgi:hypothetical protein
MADRGIIGINRVVLFNTSFAWAIYGSGSPQIFCPNLIQFEQLVVSKHL